MNKQQQNRIINLGLVLFGFVLACEILFYHSAVTNWLCGIVERTGAWGWIVIFALQFIQVVFIPIPAYFVTLTSMKMYPNNLIELFCVTLISVLLGVLIAYLIGRKWGKKAVIWASGSEQDYEHWVSVLQSKKTGLFYLITVLLPIFPDDILCLIAGSIKINFGWFMFCNILGRAIGLVSFMFFFTAVGNGLTSIIAFGVVILALLIWKICLTHKQ